MTKWPKTLVVKRQDIDLPRVATAERGSRAGHRPRTSHAASLSEQTDDASDQKQESDGHKDQQQGLDDLGK